MRWPSWFNPTTWGIVLIWYFSNIGARPASALLAALRWPCTAARDISCGTQFMTFFELERRRHHAQQGATQRVRLQVRLSCMGRHHSPSLLPQRFETPWPWQSLVWRVLPKGRCPSLRRYPILLTQCHMAACSIMAYGVASAGVVPRVPLKSRCAAQLSHLPYVTFLGDCCRRVTGTFARCCDPSGPAFRTATAMFVLPAALCRRSVMRAAPCLTR